MRKIFCILLTISIIQASYGQSFFIKDSLLITGTTEFFTPDSTKIKAIFLENRDNRDLDFLPIYRKTLNTPDGTSITGVVLKNISYSSVAPNIYKGVYKISTLGTEPQVSAKVVKFKKQNNFEIWIIYN